MADTYTFDESGVRRIVDVVRQIEREPFDSLQDRGPGPNTISPRVSLVKITSITTTAGLYPGRWQYWDGAAYQNATANSQDCWLDLEGATGVLNSIYTALSIGPRTADGIGIFACGGAGSGGGGAALEVHTTNSGTGDVAADSFNTTIIQIDQGSGLKEVDNTGGNVTLSLQPTSNLHAGGISLTAKTTEQILGTGSKSVIGKLTNYGGQGGLSDLSTYFQVDGTLTGPYYVGVYGGGGPLARTYFVWPSRASYGGSIILFDIDNTGAVLNAQYGVAAASGAKIGQYFTIPNTFNNIIVSGGLITGWN